MLPGFLGPFQVFCKLADTQPVVDYPRLTVVAVSLELHVAYLLVLHVVQQLCVFCLQPPVQLDVLVEDINFELAQHVQLFLFERVDFVLQLPVVLQHRRQPLF